MPFHIVTKITITMYNTVSSDLLPHLCMYVYMYMKAFQSHSLKRLVGFLLRIYRIEDMAQVVAHLSTKHEALS
jgi:hypothetical protein